MTVNNTTTKGKDMTNATRDIQADTVADLLHIQKLIETNPTEAFLSLSRLASDLSSSAVSIQVEVARPYKMRVPACRNTADLAAYNID